MHGEGKSACTSSRRHLTLGLQSVTKISRPTVENTDLAWAIDLSNIGEDFVPVRMSTTGWRSQASDNIQAVNCAVDQVLSSICFVNWRSQILHSSISMFSARKIRQIHTG